MWPSNRFTNTGVAGDTGSMTWRVGSAGDPELVVPVAPSTHSPGGVCFARSPMSQRECLGRRRLPEVDR